MLTDYLTEYDKEKLESWGYTPYNGEYGFRMSYGEGGYYKIKALLDDTAMLEFYCMGMEPTLTKWDRMDGRVNIIKTLAPLPPKEIVFDAGRFEIETHGTSGRVCMDRLGLLVDSDIGMKVQEFRENIDRGEYDLVFRRRK